MNAAKISKSVYEERKAVDSKDANIDDLKSLESQYKQDLVKETTVLNKNKLSMKELSSFGKEIKKLKKQWTMAEENEVIYNQIKHVQQER